ncbi:MAG: PhoU domain-containing protein [archaeon]
MELYKRIYDAWKKRPILEDAYNHAADILKRDQYMFNEVCTALISGGSTRESSTDEERDIVEIITEEDHKINDMARSIRQELLSYLALNSSPDLSSSLVLTSLVIYLERLGDYTKDLAQLTLLNAPKFRQMTYHGDIEKYQKHLMVMFDLTIKAFENGDKVAAMKVMNENVKLRNETDVLLHKINTDKNIRGREAMTYTLYTRYFRRVAGHLENVASSVISPFPDLGFKHAAGVKLTEKRTKMSNIVKKRGK